MPDVACVSGGEMWICGCCFVWLLLMMSFVVYVVFALMCFVVFAFCSLLLACLCLDADVLCCVSAWCMQMRCLADEGMMIVCLTG